jgi:hypothetical protein
MKSNVILNNVFMIISFLFPAAVVGGIGIQ